MEYFVIEVCKPLCAEVEHNRTETTADVSVEYYTTFTIRVIAVYKQAGFAQIERYSEHHRGKSGVAPTRNFFENIQLSQVENTVRLGWLPPLDPDGPMTYYEVFVFDTKSKKIIYEYV